MQQDFFSGYKSMEYSIFKKRFDQLQYSDNIQTASNQKYCKFSNME